MDKKIEEMIAIGASVTANCIPCIRFHVGKGRETGLTEDEIRAAVQVGRMVRKGAARKWDEEAGALLAEQAPSCREKVAAGGGCS